MMECLQRRSHRITSFPSSFESSAPTGTARSIRSCLPSRPSIFQCTLCSGTQRGPSFSSAFPLVSTDLFTHPRPFRQCKQWRTFFVDEARHNSHRFASAEDEAANLIYNYAPTGPEGDSYQAYVFPPASSMVRETRQPSMV